MKMILIKIFLFLLIHRVRSAIIEKENLEVKKVFHNIEHAKKLFDDFILQYNKVYTNIEEYEYRLKIFTEKLEKVNEYNKKYEIVFGITQFMDITDEEYLEKYTTSMKYDTLQQPVDVNYGSTVENDRLQSIPEKWDWRDKGLVTPVGNQAQCGACWAFSTIGHIEGQYAKKYGSLKVFSKQEILDCSSGGDCTGGSTDSAMSGIAKYGIMEESDYPYVAKQGDCKFDKKKVKLNITGPMRLKINSEERLREALHEVGPLSAAMQATEKFNVFKGGIANNTNMGCVPNGELNHAVLLVGYGSENGIPYWIVQNSFGADWGEKGYIRLLRNENTCSIMNHIVITALK